MATDPSTIQTAYAALDALTAQIAAFDYSGLSVADQLELLSRRERLRRSAPAVDHALLAGLQAQTTPREIGAKSWADVLAMRLHISGGEALRRVREAADLGPRTTFFGEPLPPAFPHLAAAQAAGKISSEHVKIWNDFYKKLPLSTSVEVKTHAEATLVGDAALGQSPEEFRTATEAWMTVLDPDGPIPDDSEKARKRGVTLCKQQPDGTSRMEATFTPEGRAIYEALFAVLAAPGMCNPDDDHPCVSGTPMQEQIDADMRTPAQRRYDAMVYIGRHIMQSGTLGQHNGLPATTVVVTTTLQDLERGAGLAVATTGTKLPVRDLIAMAGKGAYPYLAVFDKHSNVPLYLGRARRTASSGQRLVLFARDRGCTRPGCTQPASACQAHHATADWQHDGQTDITDLALACGPDNRLVDQNDPNAWHTTMKNGRAHWTPPPLLDTGQPRVNTYHHPRLYPNTEDDDGEIDCPVSA